MKQSKIKKTQTKNPISCTPISKDQTKKLKEQVKMQ